MIDEPFVDYDDPLTKMSEVDINELTVKIVEDLDDTLGLNIT